MRHVWKSKNSGSRRLADPGELRDSALDRIIAANRRFLP
jgi:hypothetical protein